MRTALITGSSGFFGGVLKRALLADGWSCVGVDVLADPDAAPGYEFRRGDLRDEAFVRSLFAGRNVDAVFHCAALLAHDVSDREALWTSNVDATAILSRAASDAGVPSFVFISSNCLWGKPVGRPIDEDEPPCPTEIYGESKLEAERLLNAMGTSMKISILRSTTIIDEGRLGLLGILFQFIDEGRKVWVVGSGANRYQFVNAKDLASACIAAAAGPGGTYNIGADDACSIAEAYGTVIERAGTGARLARLPKPATLLAMRVCYALGISPLGPYQYRMISESFSFDTAKAKRELGWTPRVSNKEMLWRAYAYYHEHKGDIAARGEASAHSRVAKMGIIGLLRLLS